MQVSFFRNGQLLHANRGSFEFVGFGLPTGSIGNAQCFESITVTDSRNRRQTITGTSYGGPVSVCVRRGKGRQWFGIADAKTVAAAALARVVEA